MKNQCICQLCVSWQLMEFRILYLHRDGETEVLSFLITFQRFGFQVLEKETPELGETHIHLKMTKGSLELVVSLFQVNAPRKAGGSYSSGVG